MGQGGQAITIKTLRNKMSLYAYYTRNQPLDNGIAWDIKDKLLYGNWLHAWDEKRFPSAEARRMSMHYSLRDSGFSDDDLAPALEFLKKKLLSIDPTSDKRYFEKICGFFMGRLFVDDIPRARKIIESYEALRQQNPDLRSDPYVLYNNTNKPGIKRRAIKADPLDAAMSMHDLRHFVDGFSMRPERAKGFKPFSYPADVKPDDQIHTAEEFCIYNSSVRDSSAICIELSNGARYRMEPRNSMGLYPPTVNEHDQECMPERLIKDIHGLAEAIAPMFSHREPHSQYSKVFDFAHLLKAAGKASLFEEGLIAQAFEDKYKEKLSFLEEIKREEAEHSDQPRASYAWRERNPHASGFYNLYDHIATLAHFPEERALVSGEFIAQIFKTAIEAGAVGSARRALSVINTVEEWRDALLPQDIAPVLHELSTQKTEMGEPADVDISELFDETASLKPCFDGRTHKYLSHMMAFVATTSYWRDGSEAVHLPSAIDHILRAKDWHRLKLILVCSTKPNDPVSQQWRDAIPRELRDKIEDNRFDNSYKFHSIHLLMKRMKDLEEGNNQRYRLRQMPYTDAERRDHEAANASKRARRSRMASLYGRLEHIG